MIFDRKQCRVAAEDTGFCCPVSNTPCGCLCKRRLGSDSVGCFVFHGEKLSFQKL